MRLIWIVCLLLLVTLPVYAGHYTVAYSGGVADNVPNEMNEGRYESPVSVKAKQCSGTITATFTWHPDTTNDAPPQSVLVRQSATAGWRMGIGPVAGASGNCEDGLGDPEKRDDYGGDSDGTHTKITTNPGPSFTVQCTPVASVVSSDPNAIAAISYQADAFPIVIDLVGTRKDTNGIDTLLVGQNCTASVTVPGLTEGVVFGAPKWTIAGKTYTSFKISPTQTFGHAVPYPKPDVPSPTSPTWYWIDGDPRGSLKTIQVSSDIKYGDAMGTVTAQKTVSVWSPSLFLAPNGGTNPAIGTVAIQPDDQNGPGAIISNAPPQQTGFEVVAAVSTPELFATDVSNTGQWAWLQLCRLNVTLGGTGTRMKTFQLDSAFPYNTSAATEDVPGVTWTARSTAKKPAYQYFSDSPEEGWAGSDTVLAFDNVYRLYAMYQPPKTANGAANWVPVQSFQWSFHGHIARPNLLSTHWTPDPPGAITYSGSEKNPDYPFWTAKFGSGG